MGLSNCTVCCCEKYNYEFILIAISLAVNSPFGSGCGHD